MSFLEHLSELRKRILISLGFIFLGSIGGYILSGRVLEILSKPVKSLYFFAPPEAFLIRIKIGIGLGVVFSLPLLLHQLWLFISPALKREERRYAVPIISIAYLLFLAGAGFAYFLILPAGIKILLSFGSESVHPLMNLSKYFTFVFWLLLFSGLLFQLPLIVFFLVRTGIVEEETLRKHHKTIVVVIFILAAVLTPTVDFITMLLLALPLLALYEVSILAARIGRKRH